MNINLIAPINPLGYGVVGHNVLRELVAQGHDVAWWPIGNPQGDFPVSPKLYQDAYKKQETYDPWGPSVRIWHQNELALQVGWGPHVGFPIFELDPLRRNEAHHLKAMNPIFVTSEWARGVVFNSFRKYRDEVQSYLPDDIDILHEQNELVYVIPLGVDTDIFQPSHTKPDPHWTTFFNCGKWEYRKGHDVLIEAFNEAFEPSDRVRLWMMNHNPFLEPQQNKGVDGNAEWQGMYKNTPMGNRISFLPRVRTPAEVAKIMNEVDCGVFPSRGEGWNLELLEMMACGKEVIATNYSGHTEFIIEDNSMMIDVDGMEEAYDGKWFFGNDEGFGNWAKFGKNAMKELTIWLRYVYDQKQKGEDLFNAGGLQTAQTFTWTNTVNKMVEVLELGET
jgi:glycosyltransferase involved in cell wall biosynthesis